MNNLRVCIVAPLFHPGLGGPGRQSSTIAGKLREKGVEVIVIARRLDIELPESGVPVFMVSTPGADVHTLQDFTFFNFIISLCFSIGAAIRLVILRKRYDIVHFYGAGLPLLFCILPLRLLRKKVAVKVSGARRGMEAGSMNGALLKPFLLPLYRLADVFIAISDELEKMLLSEGFKRDRVVKIPNGVDTELFQPVEEKTKKELKERMGLSEFFRWIFTGRLAERKGLEMLLDVFRRITGIDRKSVLMIAGDGPLMYSLKKKAESDGIMEKVVFMGNVINIQDYLNAADVFVFPSMSEGMPNSLLEAMACGLPVIASKIGGVVDIVEDGKSGILFDSGNASELTSAMIRLLNDESLRQKLSIGARQRIVESFSIDRIAEEYIRLYGKLLALSSQLKGRRFNGGRD